MPRLQGEPLGDSNAPLPGEVDFQTEPGRVNVKPLHDEEDNWYWHAYIGDTRINGGMVHSYADGMMEGQRAIGIWRRKDFHENFMFDVETEKWVKKTV